MSDELESRLRAAFRGPLPAAPVTLVRALEQVTSDPVVARRARRTTSGWGALGVAALLATAAFVGLSVGSRNGLVVPSDPRPSPAGATSTPGEGPVLGVVLEARPIDGHRPTDGEMDELVAIVRHRMELAGYADVTVVRVGPVGIVVEIPVGADADGVRALAGQVGRVEIVPLGDASLQPGDVVDVADHPPLVGPEGIASAEIGTNANGDPTLVLHLEADAEPAFAEYTASHVGESFAVVLDGKVVVRPVLNSAIPGGEIEIAFGRNGGWDPDEMRRLVAMINAGGTLPVPFVETSSPQPAGG